MLLRVRTNLGITRIEVSDNTTLLELKEKIKEILKINYPAVSLTLSLRVDGQEHINDNQTRITDLGIRHGSEVFIVGRFEKNTVEKSFVGSDGNVVAAGTTLNLIEEHDDAELDAIMGTHNMSVIDSSAESVGSTVKKEESVSVAVPTTATPEPVAADSAVNDPPQDNYDYDANEYSNLMDYQEEEDRIRAPDVAQSMTLLEDPRTREGGFNLSSTQGGRMLMHAVLTDEENAEVAQLESTLRAAGLREYEVLLEVQQLQDELIARRLQRDITSSSMGDTLTAAMYQNNVLGEGMLEHMQRLDRTLDRYHSNSKGYTKAKEVLRLPAHPQPSPQPAQSTRTAPTGTSSSSQRSDLTTSTTTSSHPSRGNTVNRQPSASMNAAVKKSSSQKEEGTNSNSARLSVGKSRLNALQHAALQSFPPATTSTSAGPQRDDRHRISGEKVSTAARKPGSAPAPPSSRRIPLSAGPLGLSEVDASASLLQDSVDEEALLKRLSDEYASHVGTTERHTVSQGNSNKLNTTAGKTTAVRRPVAGKKAAADPAPLSSSAGLGLKGAGYKPMAQIRAERIGVAKSSSLKASGTAPVSATASAPAFTTQSSGHVAREKAVHSSSARPSSGVKASTRSQKTGTAPPVSTADASNYSTAQYEGADREEMDDSLALALQLSLQSTSMPSTVERSGSRSPGQWAPAPLPHSGSRIPTNYPSTADRPRMERPYAPDSRADVHINRHHDIATGAFERTLREAGATVDYARRLQEQCDAATAAEIMRIEAEDAAAARLYQEQFNRDVERVHLRERLHHRDTGNDGPPAAAADWLDHTVNQHANAGLFNLGVQRSMEPVPYDGYDFGIPRAAAMPPRPVMAAAPPQPVGFDPMQVEYDQEDELLARAMQESLNEEDYLILD